MSLMSSLTPSLPHCLAPLPVSNYLADSLMSQACSYPRAFGNIDSLAGNIAFRYVQDSFPYMIQVSAQVWPYQRRFPWSLFQNYYPDTASPILYSNPLPGFMFLHSTYYNTTQYIFNFYLLVVYLPLLEYKLHEARDCFAHSCIPTPGIVPKSEAGA